MRRGTPSAQFFGNLLFLIRTTNNQSMRQVAEEVGAVAATVSQVEKGQRALKEPKIKMWAKALNVKETDFRELWWLSQGMLPGKNGKRIFYDDKFDTLCHKISTIMDIYCPDFIIQIPRIELLGPVVRKRGIAATQKKIKDIFESLSSPERNRVLGYIDAIIEQREDI